MINKKTFLILCVIFLFQILILPQSISAASLNIQFPESGNSFAAGEKIKFLVSLYDNNTKPIEDEVIVILEDSIKKVTIEKKIQANNIVEIEMQGASYGEGRIIAKYGDAQTEALFEIKIQELARFEIKEDKLIITNIGNTKYVRTVYITIGETTGTKNVKLEVGESISYRLVAPEGTYRIKVNDGNSETELIKEGIYLTGTGKVIGAIDETPSERSPLTGGIRPDENQDENLLSYMKNNGKFVYTFIVVIFGAMILLAIERRYKKKL